jgi:hypothetical protein
MSTVEHRSNGPQLKTAPLVTGAALVGAGTLLALVGLAVGGGHLIEAVSKWINEMETSPSEQAKVKWAQAKAAMAAGAAAWQDGQQQQQPIPAQASRTG